MAPKTQMGRLWDAIRAGDVEEVARVLRADQGLLETRPPFAGGTWLHLAAAIGNLEVVKYLVDAGLNVNDASTQDGDLPLGAAAAEGRLDIARYLLDRGSRMDTSASVRNPLFAAIVGRSADIARLLLERGIVATVRYNSDTMKDMDATAFAIMRGEGEIARIVALHNAGGDAKKAEALLADAQAIAAQHGPLRPTHIVPTDEDLEN